MKKWQKVLAIIGVLVLVLGLTAYLVLQLPPFGGRFTGARWERMQQSVEFVKGRFENTPPQKTDSSLLKNFQLYQQGQQREPQFDIPVVSLESDLQKPAAAGLKAYWFGHASVLVELEGIRIMTDPILSDYASPFAIGPKRFHRPPVPLEKLTNIDAVVISHDHYDHLDMPTIKVLASQRTHFYVPLGIGAHLERWGVPAERIHELDWWQSAELNGVQIHCTPARHYSGRKAMDNSTLWSSWVLRGQKHMVYFSGDTGYSPHFADIHRAFGDMDLTLMKVGAYGETWLDIHMDPESSVQAHMDLGGKVMLPIHWATFNLAYHAWEEPIIRTLAAATAKGVHVITPRVGEVFDFDQPFENQPWYMGQKP